MTVAEGRLLEAITGFIEAWTGRQVERQFGAEKRKAARERSSLDAQPVRGRSTIDKEEGEALRERRRFEAEVLRERRRIEALLLEHLVRREVGEAQRQGTFFTGDPFEPGGHYVYLLWGSDCVMYVGESGNVLYRIGSHRQNPVKRVNGFLQRCSSSHKYR